MAKIMVICEKSKNGTCEAKLRMCYHRKAHPISEYCFHQSEICFEFPKCNHNPVQANQEKEEKNA